MRRGAAFGLPRAAGVRREKGRLFARPEPKKERPTRQGRAFTLAADTLAGGVPRRHPEPADQRQCSTNVRSCQAPAPKKARRQGQGRTAPGQTLARSRYNGGRRAEAAERSTDTRPGGGRRNGGGPQAPENQPTAPREPPEGAAGAGGRQGRTRQQRRQQDRATDTDSKPQPGRVAPKAGNGVGA